MIGARSLRLPLPRLSHTFGLPEAIRCLHKPHGCKQDLSKTKLISLQSGRNLGHDGSFYITFNRLITLGACSPHPPGAQAIALSMALLASHTVSLAADSEAHGGIQHTNPKCPGPSGDNSQPGCLKPLTLPGRSSTRGFSPPTSSTPVWPRALPAFVTLADCPPSLLRAWPRHGQPCSCQSPGRLLQCPRPGPQSAGLRRTLLSWPTNILLVAGVC